MHTVLSSDANVIAATVTNSFILKYQILFMNFRVTHIVKPRGSLLFLKYGMFHVPSRVVEVTTEKNIKKILFSSLYLIFHSSNFPYLIIFAFRRVFLA